MPLAIKRCESCGAPLVKDQQSLAEEGPRCRGCFHADGTPKSFAELVEALANHLVRALDLTPAAAREAAAIRLARLPAWSTRRARRRARPQRRSGP